MLRLRHATPDAWVRLVNDELVAFLQDHAANERRVSRTALTLAVQHPEREALVSALVDVSLEELEHFRLVYRLLAERGATLAQDSPDPYMKRLHKALKHADRDTWLLRRLVLGAVVEARGYERFAMLGEGLADAALRETYRELARCEARHQGLYLRLARTYFDDERVEDLLDEVLSLEADVLRDLPLTPALH
ncbi:MAG TPA: tRNA isopentenyl-2-thiomethyl-A-37 hydroxylase MiaE [Sandaracinaceae bacterium LLY-WYZ-13_1]|nr:tRNA isopentenyl-2-thiomethyl-A-37 hydroxylase MiaE [Sandaracinaceae bacterium LLY-WYZ-13_1]